MARKKTTESKRPIESYEHKGKERVNNPPVGLVTPETDPDAGAKKAYAYDPHLDPQLVWAGKAEHTSFEVPTVSLHVHERIETRTIIEAVRKKNGQPGPVQLGLFEIEREEPLREPIESGLVKTPRVVVRDDAVPDAKTYKSRLYHIYNDPDVKDDLNRRANPEEPLPDLVLNAYRKTILAPRLRIAFWDSLPVPCCPPLNASKEQSCEMG